MTDGQYRLLGQVLQTIGLAIAIVFAVAGWAHRSPILPSIAFPIAIACLLAATVLLGVYRKS
jgi:hypothetical protein